MSDKRGWSRLKTGELISSYYDSECLWNVHCPDFKDKQLKANAIKAIGTKFGTTEEEISRKIHNLRNQYNSEIKKISARAAPNPGAGYVSKWPYFHMLHFIKDSLRVTRSAKAYVSPSATPDD